MVSRLQTTDTAEPSQEVPLAVDSPRREERAAMNHVFVVVAFKGTPPPQPSGPKKRQTGNTGKQPLFPLLAQFRKLLGDDVQAFFLLGVKSLSVARRLRNG